MEAEKRRGPRDRSPAHSAQHPTRAITILPSLRLQEFEVIAQIKLLQSACNNYSIEPEGQFGAWFRAMERLSETER